MRVRRILILTTDLEIGGTPRVVRDIATRLCRGAVGGLEIHVACLAPRGPIADEIERGGVGVTALDAGGVHDLAVIGRVNRLLRAGHFDTVFSFLIHANAAAALTSAMNSHIDYVQAIQTTQPCPRWHWMLQRIIHSAAQTIVVPSESVAHAAMNRSGIPARKIRVIPNAIDLADYPPLSPHQSVVPTEIGFIGRLDPIKRVDDLIRAIPLIDPNVRLHVFGDGPQRSSLQQLANALNARVIFHGFVPRPQDALERIGLLALPSAAEGFPLVLIEAMAAGVPILATNAPGIRDVIRHGRTGLLAPPRNPPGLAASLRTLIGDGRLRGRLRKAAYADVAARFSWERVLPQYRRLLRLG